MNLKDNQEIKSNKFNLTKTKLILFFMITGWIRVLMIVIPGILLWFNYGDYRDNVNTPTVKMEQRN